MKLTIEEMRGLYQRQTARSRDGRAECLSENTMVRAAAGELSQSERELIADHLAICSDCSEEYRLLREMKPWAERAALSAFEGEPLLIPANARSGMGNRIVQPQPGWAQLLIGIFSTRSATYALATALLVVSLAGAAWIISLKRENALTAARLNEQLAARDQASGTLADARRELEETARRAEQQQTEIAELRRSIEELSQPQVNIPITDLEQQGERGGGSGVTTMAVPAGANIFTLILHVTGEPSFPDYALEVMDGRGQRVTRAQKLRKSQLNTFTVALPRRLMPAGQYRLKLFGLRAGRSEVIAEYQLRLNYQKE
jgi:anti-sigma factor RsiW